MVRWVVGSILHGGPFELFLVPLRARCSSMVRSFAHGVMGHRIDPSWWTHWAIFHSSQCSTTGVTKPGPFYVLSLSGARCSSVVRAFTHGAMGHRINHSWWTHWAISHSSQCSSTGITKKKLVYVLSCL